MYLQGFCLACLSILFLPLADAEKTWLTLGARTMDRPKGLWSGNMPNNGTLSDSPLQPFSVVTLASNVLWCSKIQIPAPGMEIQQFGLFTTTIGAGMKLLLYDDSEFGYPQGAPLVNRTFTSVQGKNEFNFDPATEYQRWYIARGGSDFAWLCVLHNRAGGASFFVVNGSATDGPRKEWLFNNPSNYDWANFDATQPDSGYYQLKTNAYIYGPSLATDSPTLTATSTDTRSTSLTPTLAHTPTPTQTPTATPSSTISATISYTATAVPTYDPQYYAYNGIPAPQEVLTVPWVDFYPYTAIIGEEVTCRVEGWHNFWEHAIFFKVGRGRGYDDCYGVQDGSEVQQLVNNTIKLRALKADTYRICYKIRNDWEPLERRFIVTNKTSAAFEGYNSCAAFLAINASYCGCFLGTVGEQVLVPSEFPLHLLLPRQLNKVVEMGCCQDTSKRRITVGTGLADWGYCTSA